MSRSRMVFRGRTAVAVALAVVCVVIAGVYFAKTAAQLPVFFPGHDAKSSKHHTKHGIGFTVLAIAALVGAWMTSAPEDVDPSV